MSPQPDEKRLIVIAILDQLRIYKPAIGNYAKSIYTPDFDYSVKLSNGRIRLPEELIDDYQLAPASISLERFKNAANRFVPDEAEIVTTPPMETVQEVLLKTKSSGASKNWRNLGIVAILFIVILFIVSTNQKNKEDNELSFARTNIYSQVTVEGSSYMVNQLFGGISDLRITVTNNSDYLVDIVKVKVSYIKANGALYKEEKLYFNQLGAHSTQTLDAPKSNRGTKVSIETESLTCTALQIN